MTEPDPRVKIFDVLFPRLAVPDLGLAEEFLSVLGLVPVERTERQLFLRGTGTANHIYVAELGEPRFIGMAFTVTDEEDLHRLAKLPGASAVHELDEPGGGRRVTLTEPNGYQIEVIHGMAPREPLVVPPLLSNSALEPARRIGVGPWGPDQPPHAWRFGHAVQKTEKFGETIAWYQNTLGLVPSEFGDNGEGEINGVFFCPDGGERWVDHHCLQIAAIPQTGWHHVSFEVQNWSEVFEGAAYLAKQGRYKVWGSPQRHHVGGQVGIYVSDPWGRLHEFWSDGDRVNNTHKPRTWTMEEIIDGPLWGEAPGFEFFMQVAQ